MRAATCAELVTIASGLEAVARCLAPETDAFGVALVEEGGMSREGAYAIVQAAALRAADERRPLRDLLAADPEVTGRLDASHLDACFADASFLAHVPEVIARLDGLVAPAADPGAAS